MGKRGAGVALLAISAFMYAMRFIVSAQIAGPLHFDNFDENKVIFNQYVSDIGKPLLVWSILALCGGILYIALAEIKELRAKSTAKTPSIE